MSTQTHSLRRLARRYMLGDFTAPANIFPSLSNLYCRVVAGAQTFKDAGSTPCADLDTVQQWNDQSGNAFNFSQATAGNRPKFHTNQVNGQPAVEFGLTTAVAMANSWTSISPPLSAFLVVKPQAVNNAAINLFFDGLNNTCQFAYAAGSTTASNPYIFQGTVVTATGPLDSTKFNYVSLVFNGTSSVIRINGVDVTPATHNPGGSSTGAGMVLGNQLNTGGTLFMQMLLAEWCFYSAAVSSTGITSIETYFKARYGLS